MAIVRLCDFDRVKLLNSRYVGVGVVHGTSEHESAAPQHSARTPNVLEVCPEPQSYDP